MSLRESEWEWVNLKLSELIWIWCETEWDWANVKKSKSHWTSLSRYEWVWVKLNENKWILEDLSWSESGVHENQIECIWKVWVNLIENDEICENLDVIWIWEEAKLCESLWDGVNQNEIEGIWVRHRQSEWIQARLGGSEQDRVNREEIGWVKISLGESAKECAIVSGTERVGHSNLMSAAFPRESPLPTILLSNFSWLYR